MANTNAPFGLLPLGVQNGGTPSFELKQGQFALDNTTPCTRGDGLVQLSTGYLSKATAADAATGQAVANWRGIFWGCQYLSAAFGRTITTQYWPGADNSSQLVQVFYIPLNLYPAVQIVAQSDGTPFTRTMIGNQFYITTAAPTLFGAWARSNTTIAMASVNTTATLPWRLSALWSSIAQSGTPGTDDTTNYNWGVLEFNGAGQAGS